MMDALEFVKILNDKRRIVSLLIILGVIIGILAFFVLPAEYESRTTFMVLESKLIRRNLEGRKLDIDTYLDFVNNESIYHSVYNDLDIRKKYDLNFEEFKKCFDVTSVEDTAIINFVVTFQNPEVCLAIAQSVGNQALALNHDIINREIQSGHRFTEDQVAAAASQMETSRRALDTFLSEHPVPQLALKVDTLRNRIAIEKNGGLAVYPPMEGILGSQSAIGYPTSVTQISSTQESYQSITKIQSEIAETSAKLKYARGDNQKLQLAHKLEELKTLLQSKEKTLNGLMGKLKNLEESYYPLKNQFAKLQSEFIAAQKGYDEIYRQAVDVRMEVAGKTKEMSIISAPVKADKPVFPKFLFTLLGGILLGVVSAFIYIILVGFNRKLSDA